VGKLPKGGKEMKILYNFASRNRPDRFFAALDNIKEFSISGDYIILAKIDDDDPCDYSRISEYDNVIREGGFSESKIHAINRGIFPGGWDILVNMSDDMRFITMGYDEIIRQHCGPDDFLHFPDLDADAQSNSPNKDDSISTMSIMGRDYYNRFGYVYHPEYSSLWCDNEATAVAKLLGRYKHVPVRIFEHLHCAWGKAPRDAQYIKTESFFYKDKNVFNKRKAKGFPA
jgi:hypothetical protein